jgi:hypothetical protein
MTRMRAALAGAAAAVAWGLLEPLDQRVFRYPYSDVALLGLALTRRRAWRSLGFAIHAGNGAAFGVAWREANQRTGVSPVTFALAEHVGLFPLGTLVDRYHPARGTSRVPRIFSGRAFVQATVRHLFFGWLLGRLAGAPRALPTEDRPAPAADAATPPPDPSPSPRA